jgi:hypothetical protein
LLAAHSLPHDMGNDRIRRLKSFLVNTIVAAAMADEVFDIFRERFARRFPIISVSAATGEGLETLPVATYHLLTWVGYTVPERFFGAELSGR